MHSDIGTSRILIDIYTYISKIAGSSYGLANVCRPAVGTHLGSTQPLFEAVALFSALSLAKLLWWGWSSVVVAVAPEGKVQLLEGPGDHLPR